MHPFDTKQSRRTHLTCLATATTSLAFPQWAFGESGNKTEPIKLGIIADTHIGFVDDATHRFDLFMKDMAKQKPDGMIQLGDFAYPNGKHQAIVDTFNAGAKVTIHAIGNHDLDHSHTRKDCINSWGIPASYYTRNVKWLKIVVLDGNDKGSPTHATHGGYPSYIGNDQTSWLEKQLKIAESPVLIVSHQPLAGRSAVDNAKEIQAILSKHKGKIFLCINGHSHVDQKIEINGVTYLHINSASYFWLGGKARLAKYTDPLYAIMTLDPNSKMIEIQGVESSWLNKNPKDLNYFTGKNADAQNIVVPKIRNRDLKI